MEIPLKSVDIPKTRPPTGYTGSDYIGQARGDVPRAKANIARTPFERVPVLIA